MPQVNKRPQTKEGFKKFWNFVQESETQPPELILYGPISGNQSWFEDRVTPQKFRQELLALGDVSEIVVRINSGGGDVFAANAIYTLLRDHNAKITVKIDGWAASAATIVAMAGDVIKIPKNGVFMIHDPIMTVWDSFRAEDFEKMAGELKTIKQSIINTYAMRTGKNDEEISQFMSEETWWLGEEAVSNGFCDELLFEESNTVVENASKIIVNSVAIDLSGYKTVPKTVLDRFESGIINSTELNKEVHKMDEKVKITTVEALKAAYPDLTTEITNSAKEEERNRIKAIQDIAIDGFEDIVVKAMFEKPESAEAVAMKIISEQKKAGNNYLENRKNDVANSGINNVGAGTNKGDESKPDIIDQAIDRLLSKEKNKEA